MIANILKHNLHSIIIQNDIEGINLSVKTTYYGQKADAEILQMRAKIDQKFISTLLISLDHRSNSLQNLFEVLDTTLKDLSIIDSLTPELAPGKTELKHAISRITQLLDQIQKSFSKENLPPSVFESLKVDALEIERILKLAFEKLLPSKEDSELIDIIRRSPTRKLTIEILASGPKSPKSIFDTIIHDKGWSTTLTTVLRSLQWFIEDNVNLVEFVESDIRKRGREFKLTERGRTIHYWLTFNAQSPVTEISPSTKITRSEPIGDKMEVESLGAGEESIDLWSENLKILRTIEMTWKKLHPEKEDQTVNTSELRDLIWMEQDEAILKKILNVLIAAANLQRSLQEIKKDTRDWYKIQQQILYLLNCDS